MSVALCGDLAAADLRTMIESYGMRYCMLPLDTEIPGSFHGESEAGLLNNDLYIRSDTPIHSALHEACHYICMTPDRRKGLDTDAGGDYDEENAVCYLQILLSDRLSGYSSQSMMEDMDAWGYTFRLGSSSAWFNEDAEDAKEWLFHHGIINNEACPTGHIRTR